MRSLKGFAVVLLPGGAAGVAMAGAEPDAAARLMATRTALNESIACVEPPKLAPDEFIGIATDRDLCLVRIRSCRLRPNHNWTTNETPVIRDFGRRRWGEPQHA